MLKSWVQGAVVLVLLAIPVFETSQRFDLSFPSRENLSSPEFVSNSASPRTVFVHLFEWKWEDVAQECETFLGPKGFDAVQISPPNEHVVVADQGFPWWQRYQPVSYRLESRSGDRAQFAEMVSRCRAVGVKIYADTVINHMAGRDRGVGSAGSPFTKYHYPGIYDSEDFHACRQPITTYTDHDMVTSCELVGLADLDTGSIQVQQQIANYLLDLLSLGVSGFRIDAAKHIHTQDLGAILNRVEQSPESDPFIVQEVIDPGNEAVRKTEYYPHGNVNEFEYGRLVGAKFLGIEGQTLSQLETLGESWGLAPSDKAIVFIDNHDKQRGHGGGGTYLTYKSGSLYDLANVFMLAWNYGYPQLMSSYAFEDSDQGPPADARGNTESVYVNGQANCFQEWRCEHRHGAIANMVGFRNFVDPEAPITHWWSNGNNQIAFGRGNQGFVVINREAEVLTHTFQTSLAPGQYCNVIRGELSPDGRRCTGTGASATITVDETGQTTVTVGTMEAIAIYAGQKLL